MVFIAVAIYGGGWSLGITGGILIALNVEESTATQVTAIITSAGSIIAYIFGESIVDANYAQAENVFTNEELSDE